jgi:hypothetical protein
MFLQISGVPTGRNFRRGYPALKRRATFSAYGHTSFSRFDDVPEDTAKKEVTLRNI